jgi:glucokinase
MSAPGEAFIAAMDVGGTHVSCGLVDTATWQLVSALTRLPVAASGSAADIVANFLAATRGLPKASAAPRWGVAMPDPFDYANGVALFRGVAKFDSLWGLDLRATLMDGISPQPSAVDFVNDADAFILGEWVNGAASGRSRCAGLTLGTGIGSGFLIDGEVVDSGPNVPPGGRAHRLVVDGTPLEEIMSRRAIRRAYARASGDREADVREICDRARNGDGVASETIGQALRGLGSALGPWFARFGAEVVVVGGSMTGSWDVLEPPFLEGLEAVSGTEPPTIELACDADRAPLAGAAYHSLMLSRYR